MSSDKKPFTCVLLYTILEHVSSLAHVFVISPSVSLQKSSLSILVIKELNHLCYEKSVRKPNFLGFFGNNSQATPY